MLLMGLFALKHWIVAGISLGEAYVNTGIMSADLDIDRTFSAS